MVLMYRQGNHSCQCYEVDDNGEEDVGLFVFISENNFSSSVLCCDLALLLKLLSLSLKKYEE